MTSRDRLPLKVHVDFEDERARSLAETPCPGPDEMRERQRAALALSIPNAAELNACLSRLANNQRYLAVGREIGGSLWVTGFTTYDALRSKINERVSEKAIWAVNCYDVCAPGGPAAIGRVSAPGFAGWS